MSPDIAAGACDPGNPSGIQIRYRLAVGGRPRENTPMISPRAVHSGSQRIGTDTDPTSIPKTSQEALRTTSNAQKLRMLCEVFGLRPADVARATGTSKALISMVLGGSRPGSPAFWFGVERNLAKMVEQRRVPAFVHGSSVAPIDVLSPCADTAIQAGTHHPATFSRACLKASGW